MGNEYLLLQQVGGLLRSVGMMLNHLNIMSYQPRYANNSFNNNIFSSDIGFNDGYSSGFNLGFGSSQNFIANIFRDVDKLDDGVINGSSYKSQIGQSLSGLGAYNGFGLGLNFGHTSGSSDVDNYNPSTSNTRRRSNSTSIANDNSIVYEHKFVPRGYNGEVSKVVDKKYRLSSPFGPRDLVANAIKNGVTVTEDHIKASKDHKGVDINLPKGTPIRVPIDGTVRIAGNRQGYGYAVYIVHGDGKETRYGHLSQINVKQGQKLKAGDVLGLSGGVRGEKGSGTSTGAHLHFEYRENDVAKDPKKYGFYELLGLA